MRRLLILVGFLAAAGAFQGSAEPGNPFSFRGRVHVSDLGFYQDGGTVSFSVSDTYGHSLQACFDGRVQIGGAGFPQHMYLGGHYPDRSGTRALPLWGPEERALVSLLHSALCDTLSSDQLRLLQWARSYQEIGGLDIELWHFVAAVESRRRVHDALDRGYLMHEDDVAHWFGVEGRLSVAGVSQDAPGFSTVIVSDASGERVTVGVPTESPADSSWIAGAGYHLRLPVGSWEDRCAISLVAHAISQGPESDKIKPLQTALEKRRQLILSADTTAEGADEGVSQSPRAAQPR